MSTQRPTATGASRLRAAHSSTARISSGVTSNHSGISSTVAPASRFSNTIDIGVRKGGTISVPGAYVGFVDKLPFGALMSEGLTLKAGQTHVQRYLQPLLKRIEAGEIDPSFVITHRLPLEDAPAACKRFQLKQDGCIKVVLKPNGNA